MGIVAIGRGVTNAFILRELLRITGYQDFEIDIDNYVAGVITEVVCASDVTTRSPEVIFRKGIPEIKPLEEVINEMTSTDILIKGGNILGPDFVAGVLVAHPRGGTIGSIYARAISSGIKIIVPISLEKMVHLPVSKIVPELGGQEKIDYTRGLPTSLFPIVGGIVYTEIEAIKSLGKVSVLPIGSGGIKLGGTVLEITGSEKEIKQILENYEHVIDTKPLKVSLRSCKYCNVAVCYNKRKKDRIRFKRDP
jgi:hypothetical protein